MDTVIQAAFGAKVDSLTDQNNPIIVNIKKIFGRDMTLKTILTLVALSTTPRLCKLFGVRFAREAVTFFEKLASDIVNKKREEFRANHEKRAKANNFIELMIEAEFELEHLQQTNGGGDAKQKAVKCKVFDHF